MIRNTALVTATRDSHAIEPRDFSEAFRMAEVLHNSRFFPSCTSPEQAMAVLLKGRELGIPSMQAMTEIHVIKGKIQLSAALMAGLVLRSGLAEYFTCVDSTTEQATYATKRKGDPTGEKRLTFSIADAQRMGLAGNDNYKKQPAVMLRARATTALARMVYPDVLSGCYAPEEIDDIQTPEQVTAIVEEKRKEATGKALDALTAAPPKVARQAKPAPIVEARQRLDAADTADKLDDFEARVNASRALNAEDKATLLREIAEKRTALTRPAHEQEENTEPSPEEVARAEAPDRAAQAEREGRRSRP